MAGGASLAPRRWSLPASAMDARSRSAWTLTPRMTATRKARNWALACGSWPGSSRFSPSSVRHRPVVVLARAVDARERLLVDEEHQAVLEGQPAHRRHHEHVVVGADRGGLVDRRHLELGRRDLVVARLGRDAQAPQLAVQIHHERQDALADRAEVLVLELLALGRRRPEQGPAGEHAGPAAARRACGRSGSTPARGRCW